MFESDIRLSGCSNIQQCSLVRGARRALTRPAFAGALGLAVFAVFAGPAALHAQAPAATFAPHDHWTRAVLRRIALDGALDAGAATAAWPLREDVIAGMLESAAAGQTAPGGSTAPQPRAVLGGFARLLARERSDIVRGAHVRLSVRAGPTFDGSWNELRAGNSVPDATGYFYPGPLGVDDRSDIGALVDVDAAWKAIGLRITSGPPHEDAREAYVTASAGRVALWVGRRGLSLGATARGGIVLGDAARFTGGGVETAEPFRLPAFMRALGEVRISQTLARMERSGEIDDPWFLATRISLAPHARFALGLNRAAIFGGEGNEGVNARRVLLMLIGLGDVAGKDSDFENQIASFDVYWKPPAPFPLALYAEYGTEDRDGAIVHVPAYVVGLEAARHASSPWSAALEHVSFARSTRTYPEWYRHGALGGGWSDDGSLLGLPLGGHGDETSLAVRYDDAPRRVTTSARISFRDRGDENLFAPERAGTALVGEARLTFFAPDGLTLELLAVGERGDGWDAGSARVSLVRTF